MEDDDERRRGIGGALEVNAASYLPAGEAGDDGGSACFGDRAGLVEGAAYLHQFETDDSEEENGEEEEEALEEMRRAFHGRRLLF